LLLAADAPLAAPAEEGIELPEGVTRVALPPGPVKWENVRTKGGMILRVSADETVVEGRHLFYGDGKQVMEVRATAEGMHFVHWTGWQGHSRSSGTLNFLGKEGIQIDGMHLDEVRTAWFIEPSSPKPGDLRSGSVYVTTPSVKFERRAALKRGADGRPQVPLPRP
jgi:hypothetical protein